MNLYRPDHSPHTVLAQVARPFLPRRPWLAVLVLAGTVGACGHTPQPAPFIAAGSASVEAARAGGAPELAPVALDEARGKLQRAQALAQAGNEVGAVRLAQQAEVDARLALALASAERSRRSAAEVEAGLQVLRDELGRRSQQAFPPTGQPAQPMDPAQLQPPRPAR